ncbi:MAG: hypothetical protein M1814_001764 [Vezdaea aestivalis]|nr:MAG: hypothetical protein M1814_001764 [Vezdaea aestivalis]
MQFITSFVKVALVAAVAVNALPQPEVGPVSKPDINTITVKQAAAKCTGDQTLSCCNKKVSSGDSAANGGALSGLLGGSEALNLFGQCSKLNVAALIGVSDLLNKQCSQTAACCQGNEFNQQGALIGIGCLPITNLL